MGPSERRRSPAVRLRSLARKKAKLPEPEKSLEGSHEEWGHWRNFIQVFHATIWVTVAHFLGYRRRVGSRWFVKQGGACLGQLALPLQGRGSLLELVLLVIRVWWKAVGFASALEMGAGILPKGCPGSSSHCRLMCFCQRLLFCFLTRSQRSTSFGRYREGGQKASGPRPLGPHPEGDTNGKDLVEVWGVGMKVAFFEFGGWVVEDRHMVWFRCRSAVKREFRITSVLMGCHDRRFDSHDELDDATSIVLECFLYRPTDNQFSDFSRESPHRVA